MLFSHKQSYFKEEIKNTIENMRTAHITMDGFITLKRGKCLPKATTVRKKLEYFLT